MPSDVEAAEDAYARGEYAAARRLARAILRGGAPDEERERAQRLLDRTQSDRAVYVLLAACLLFFLVILLTYTRPL
jgi:hypothetical protein